MRLSGQFQTSLFFYKKILGVKKHQSAKQATFTLLEVFVRAKTCCLFFCSPVLVLLVGFGFIYVFVR